MYILYCRLYAVCTQSYLLIFNGLWWTSYCEHKDSARCWPTERISVYHRYIICYIFMKILSFPPFIVTCINEQEKKSWFQRKHNCIWKIFKEKKNDYIFTYVLSNAFITLLLTDLGAIVRFISVFKIQNY